MFSFSKGVLFTIVFLSLVAITTNAFTLIVSLFGFHNIPKALPNRILSKSRLTDWQFDDKSSWGKDFKISLNVHFIIFNRAS